MGNINSQNRQKSEILVSTGGRRGVRRGVRRCAVGRACVRKIEKICSKNPKKFAQNPATKKSKNQFSKSNQKKVINILNLNFTNLKKSDFRKFEQTPKIRKSKKNQNPIFKIKKSKSAIYRTFNPRPLRHTKNP